LPLTSSPLASSGNSPCRTAMLPVKAQGDISDQLLEDISALAQRFEDRLGKRGLPVSGLCASRRRVLAIGQMHVGEPLGAAHRQQLHKGRVHHAEDRGVRADAQRQHQHHGERESRRLAQLAQRVAKVLKQRVFTFSWIACYSFFLLDGGLFGAQSLHRFN
jgi:hypothetical protein